MKQNLILVLVILLATLSMVNAIPHQLNKRETTFAACPSGSPSSLTVSLQPDPPVAGQECLFTIGGTFAVPKGSQLTVQPLDSAGNAVGQLMMYDFCTLQGVTCPLDGTSPFSVTQSATIPAEAIPTYSLMISVIDPAGAGSMLACSLGTITGA